MHSMTESVDIQNLLQTGYFTTSRHKDGQRLEPKCSRCIEKEWTNKMADSHLVTRQVLCLDRRQRSQYSSHNSDRQIPILHPDEPIHQRQESMMKTSYWQGNMVRPNWYHPKRMRTPEAMWTRIPSLWTFTNSTPKDDL